MQTHIQRTGRSHVHFAGFDWDDGNRAKCQKHGVAIEDIESLFHRTIHVAPDPAHSSREERLKAIGVNDKGRMYWSFSH